MRVRVRAFGDLMEALGRQMTVELEAGSKLKDLITALSAKVGGSRKGYLGRHSVTGPTLTILINGRNVRTLGGVETSLEDGDTVTLLPPVVGGLAGPYALCRG